MRLSTASTLLVLFLASLPTVAKLPPLTDDAKAKAAAEASKTAWGTKVAGFQLCNAMNKAAAHYHATAQRTGNPVPTAVDTPACADAGPYVPPLATPPPLESSGAHSPAATAAAPPSSKATEAEIKGGIKK